MVKGQIDGLDVLNNVNVVGTLKLLDSATDPTAEGEVQRNASDVKVYAGGKVVSLSNQQSNNITATAAPGVTNDTTEGYEPGSIWTDVTADKSYVCLDATEGAAVWTEITSGGGIANVVDDPSPQAGGDFDLQGNKVVGNAGLTGIAISANGEVTMTSQPAVAAYLPTSDLNKTGNGATYTLGDPTDLTEVYDQNEDFNATTGVFTAPVAGRYHVEATLQLDQGTSNITATIKIVASNRTWLKPIYLAGGASNGLTPTISQDIDMDASDTLTITLVVSGEGSDLVDIIGGAAPLSYLSVRLVA